jgi:hypothetical protein
MKFNKKLRQFYYKGKKNVKKGFRDVKNYKQKSRKNMKPQGRYVFLLIA